MMYVCLWSPSWSIGGESVAEGASADAAGLVLTDLAPRLRVEREVIWADARGLDACELADRLLGRLATAEVAARAGVAVVPVVAELAARWAPRSDGGRAGGGGAEGGGGEGAGADLTPFLVKERTGWGWRKKASGTDPSESAGGGVLVVERGREREWLSDLPVLSLRPDARLGALLDGVGLHTIGALAGLEREAVEVRLGADAVALWRLARADDRRLLFRPVPSERPHGSIEFVDYVLKDPARLQFTANALLGPICDRLIGRGEHARALRLVLPLANGEEWERTIRPARPTASRDTWLRLIRGLLERLTVPDAVAGVRIEVGSVEPAAVRQGDLFDRGFATAAAVEAAVARLAERQAPPVAPETTAHPLVERRAGWTMVALGAAGSSVGTHHPERDGTGVGVEAGYGLAARSGLALQLLPEPRRLLVETVQRRDHEAPVRIRDRAGWREVAMAAGPDRISGGRWEAEPYAREYYRCVTDEGVPLWIYRDGRDSAWYLHGWWD
jgi:protein ImuB